MLANGSYLVEVRSFSAIEEGSYVLVLAEVAIDTDEDADGPAILAVGDTIQAGLFPAGESDSWTFSGNADDVITCLLYTSPSPRDATLSRMPSSA